MKKPTLIIFPALLIFIMSCKKELTITPLNLNYGDYFIFGTYAGECTGDCARFYVIKDNNIYADDNVNYFYNDSLRFNNSPLETEKYNLSQSLLTDFPTYLLQHKNETFGCPDCTDGGALYIKLKKDGTTSYWYIDNFTYNQPEEIRNYIMQLQTVINSLR
jgi:hypothetical protein